MKVTSFNVSTNQVSKNSVNQKITKDREQELQRSSVFAANVNTKANSNTALLQQRKEKAQEKALKIVKDTFDMEKGIDNEVTDRKEHMETLKQENVNLIQEKKALEERLEGEEGQDAEARSNIESAIQVFDERIETNSQDIIGDSKTVQGIKIARLKSAPMLEAQKEADKITEAASKDMVGSLLQDAVDELDEQREEKQEKVEEQKEKEEALKEVREEDTPTAPTEEMAAKQQDVNRELKKVRDEMSLLEEDLMGAVMDEEL